ILKLHLVPNSGPDHVPIDPYDWIICTLAKTLEHSRFRVIPWTPPNSNQRHAHWKYFSHISGVGDLPTPQPSYGMNPVSEDDRTDAALADMAAAMEAQDPHSEWSVDTLSIEDLEKVIRKTCLPKMETPFSKMIDHQSPEAYVALTYEYAWEVFKVNNPMHRMAVVIAFLLGRLAPNLAIGPEAKSVFKTKKGLTPFEARRELSNFDWVINPKIKQHDTPNKIACGFIALAIGLSEPSSPLRSAQMADAREGKGVGPAWNSRHS